MRIPCKSLLILHEHSSRSGNTTTTTTTYDLQSIREHEFEVTAGQLLSHPGFWWRLGLFALPWVVLLALWSNGDPLGYTYLWLGVLTPVFALFGVLSWMVVKSLELKRLARRERGLADDANLAVIENGNWANFLAQLKQPDPLTRATLDLEQQRQRFRAMREALEEHLKKQQAEGQSPGGPTP
jgi:hypothetical protein